MLLEFFLLHDFCQAHTKASVLMTVFFFSYDKHPSLRGAKISGWEYLSHLAERNVWSSNYIEGFAYMNGEDDDGCQKLIGRDACLASPSAAEERPVQGRND